VANFFKPTSQKIPEQVKWRIINHSLIVGRYYPESSDLQATTAPRKVAAFDLDDTLISPCAGSKYRSATSWKWWDTSVLGQLRELHKQGYLVVIISNQGAISLKDNTKILQKDTIGLLNFKNQIATIMQQLDIPISVYAATAPDKYRKPRIGMWQEMLEDYDLEKEGNLNLADSFYVGDAAGRAKTEKRPKDFACSDRDLASNIGIAFKTPEEYFLRQPEQPFCRDFDPQLYLTSLSNSSLQADVGPFLKRNKQELVITCGSPAAGKSTFFWETLQPLGYERINQDTLKSRDRCIKVARDHLNAGLSVAVDNTNADIETRAHWVKVAQDFKIPIRCIRFTASPRLCEHNDTVRALSSSKETNPEGRTILPGIAFRSFAQRFMEPSLSEGFQDITLVHFRFKGTLDQQLIWTKYWVSTYST
jgi:bifunctional polynucleotide phosphatase/kinase